MQKISAVALSGLMILMTGARLVFAGTKGEKEAVNIERVKAGIAKLGVGREARVSVKLRDKTKVKGYIREVGADHFVVSDLNSDSSTTVAYADVAQVKGNNLSTGAKTAIVIGIAVGLVILAFVIFTPKT